MANSFLALVAVAAVSWLIADAATSREAVAPPARAVAGPSKAPSATLTVRSTVVEARHDPVPLVRPRTPPVQEAAASTPRRAAPARDR